MTTTAQLTVERTTIIKALETFSAVMLGTHSTNGNVEFRPMAVAGHRDDILYFITAHHSGKVSAVEKTGALSITAQSGSAYLSLNGHGEISTDRELIREFWNPEFQAWFPNGPEDPEVVLIRFVPLEGQLWDNTLLAKASYFWEVLSANVTGEKAEVDNYHSF